MYCVKFPPCVFFLYYHFGNVNAATTTNLTYGSLVKYINWYCIRILFQELRKNSEPETYVPSEEPGSTTSSTSSCVNRGGPRDDSPLFPSPYMASAQNMPRKIHRHANAGEKVVKNLPPLSNSKPSATKNDDSRYRPGQVFRSTSTREFRRLKREERLFFEIDD